MADCDRAIKLNPKFALAYFNRGSTLREHHEPERALFSGDPGARHARLAAEREITQRIDVREERRIIDA